MNEKKNKSESLIHKLSMSMKSLYVLCAFKRQKKTEEKSWSDETSQKIQT